MSPLLEFHSKLRVKIRNDLESAHPATCVASGLTARREKVDGWLPVPSPFTDRFLKHSRVVCTCYSVAFPFNFYYLVSNKFVSQVEFLMTVCSSLENDHRVDDRDPSQGLPIGICCSSSFTTLLVLRKFPYEALGKPEAVLSAAHEPFSLPHLPPFSRALQPPELSLSVCPCAAHGRG